MTHREDKPRRAFRFRCLQYLFQGHHATFGPCCCECLLTQSSTHTFNRSLIVITFFWTQFFVDVISCLCGSKQPYSMRKLGLCNTNSRSPHELPGNERFV